VLLLAASPGAMAADELGAIGRYSATIREGLRVNLHVADLGQFHLKISSSPEARLVLTDSPGGLHPVEASVKYDHGGGGPSEKVAQVSLKWRF
jgi:hypothetical protein